MILLVVLTDGERQKGQDVGGGNVPGLKSFGIVMSV